MLVVFLRGINVGGHRRLRPAALATELAHLDAVNIGATGTFVIRAPAGRRQVRSEIARRLPFPCEIHMCDGREVSRLVSVDPFRRHRSAPDMVRFVGVLHRLPRRTPDLPVRIPVRGRWLVRVLARQGRFVVGLHRREMKAIGALAELGHLFGTPATIRGWRTLEKIAKVLGAPENP